jgi:predicted lipid-binding transport protein (Tim44 family)
MNSPQAPSPLRVAVAALGWIVAMAMLLVGGIVGGTGRIALTAAAIVFLLLSVAYIGLQVWYLNRAQKGSRPQTSGRDPGPRRPR